MDDFLGKWASVATILSLVGVIIAYFSKLNEKERELRQEITDERNLASRNLYGELNDIYIALQGKECPKHLLDVKTDTKTITFTNRFLNHDLYDGFISSGKISVLKYELQQHIQDIYKKSRIITII